MWPGSRRQGAGLRGPRFPGTPGKVPEAVRGRERARGGGAREGRGVAALRLGWEEAGAALAMAAAVLV